MSSPAPVLTSRPATFVAVLAVAGIVVSLIQTAIIPLISSLPALLDASVADTAWVLTATLLTAAVATPTVGRLGDMFGKRRMLLFSLSLMIIGSAVVALSSSLTPMVIGRSLQGLSAGVVPLGISIMRDELPTERLASATAIMSASLGVGSSLGLPAAAVLIEATNWHMLFWSAAGLGVLTMALVLAFVPESEQRTGGRIDGVGVLGLSVSLTALLLAITKGADWGWAEPLTLGLFGGGSVVLVAWVRWELSRPRPLVDLRMLTRRTVLFTNMASIAMGFAMFAVSLVTPQVLQLPVSTGFGLGQSMLAVGLVLAPCGLVMILMAPVSARITRSRGPKVTLMLAAVIVCAGYVAPMFLMSEIWHFVLAAMIIGAGIGLGFGAMPALIMSAVPRTDTAAANSVNTLMRFLGTSIASAVCGVLLAHMTADVDGVPLPTLGGFRTVLVLGAGAALVALAVAALIPGRSRAAAAAVVGAEPGSLLGTGRTLAGVVGAHGPVAVTAPAYPATAGSSVSRSAPPAAR